MKELTPELLELMLLGKTPRPTSPQPHDPPDPAVSASPAPPATPPSASASDSSGPFNKPFHFKTPRELRPELGAALDYLVATSNLNAPEGSAYTLNLSAEQCEQIVRGMLLVMLTIKNLGPVVQMMAALAPRRA